MRRSASVVRLPMWPVPGGPRARVGVGPGIGRCDLTRSKDTVHEVVELVFGVIWIDLGPLSTPFRDEYAPEGAHRALGDRLTGRVLIDSGESVGMVGTQWDPEPPEESPDRHPDHLSFLIEEGLGLP